jgi:hypothetical protein
MQNADTDRSPSPERAFCVAKARSVDIEACYACGTSCAEAQSRTGREPDRDARLAETARAGIIALYR